MPSHEDTFQIEPPQKQQKKKSSCMVAAIILGVIAFGVVALLGGILFIVFSAMTWNDAYGIALQKAQQSPALKAAIGEPISAGFIVTGSIRMHNDDGVANIVIPLNGPRGTASLKVSATKENGKWTHEIISAEVAGTGQTIDVLNE